MKKILIFLIAFYQRIFSPDTGLPRVFGFSRGFTCGFSPSCSEYAKRAIEKHGATRGSVLTLKRLVGCHPWQKEFVDDV